MLAFSLAAATRLLPAVARDGDLPVWLVEFDTASLLGRLPGGGRAYLSAPAATAARNALKVEQSQMKIRIAAALGRPPTVSHHFLATVDAIAVRASAIEAARIRALPGVSAVRPERVYSLATDVAPAFVGADRVWDGSAVANGIGTRGEGRRIGVIDTGLNRSGHPSFSDDPACGHGGAQAPKVLSALDCSSSDENGLCDGPDPDDTVDHGSHVASIAAGNVVSTTAVPPPERAIAGIAPCASLRSYRVCSGLICPESAVRAAQESVLLHGDLDVVNFSVSGGTSPWDDVDAGFLDLVEHGVFVAAAAGNLGGEIVDPVGRVNHLGPWMMTVAAVSHHAEPDVLATFSLRGPTPAAFDRLTKPDLAGPGVAVYAAGAASGPSYVVLDGTSMASPAVTGAAALLRSLHPSWTPMEVKSALQTTAVPTGRSDDGVAAWTVDEVGHGRMDVAAATRAGLLLDETPQRLRSANPASATIDLRDLNLAALRNLDCQAECTFARTVRSSLDVSTGWQVTAAATGRFDLRVEPASFVLEPGAEQRLRITATERDTLGSSSIEFGTIELVPMLTDRPVQRLTLALRGDGHRVRIFSDGFDPTLVHTGPLDHPVAETDAGTSLRLVSGEAVDAAPQPGDDFNLHVPAGTSRALAIRWNEAPPRNAAVAVNSYSSRYRVLLTGDVVGPTDVYSRAAGALAEWQAGAEGYLGVRVDCSALEDPPPSGVCYGYVHLRTGGDAGLPATILDLAFDLSGHAVVIP